MVGCLSILLKGLRIRFATESTEILARPSAATKGMEFRVEESIVVSS